MKAGDAETFRLRKLSITANDSAELAGTLEEIKAEEAVADEADQADALAADGDLYLARETKEGRLEDVAVDLAVDRKLPFSAETCGLFSCHGIEPKFTRTGFEVKGKINQDRGGMQWPFGGRSDCALFAVMDGHGKGGEKISEYCMRQLPKLLQASPCLHTDPAKALKKAFLDVDAQVRKHLGRDATYAGTTCVVVLVCGSEVWIGNAGDSRAIVCAVDPHDNGRVVAKDLSIDHKPDLAAERQRVLKMGGWVSDESEEDGPARVWLTRSMDSCGLAMARSLGDHALAAVGVIAEPEVTRHTLMPYDKYLVLGSDGIWEFLSSQQAAVVVHGIMGQHASGRNGEGARAAEACRKLCELSSIEWKKNEGDYRDDITGIVCRLPCFPLSPDAASGASPGIKI